MLTVIQKARTRKASGGKVYEKRKRESKRKRKRERNWMTARCNPELNNPASEPTPRNHVFVVWPCDRLDRSASNSSTTGLSIGCDRARERDRESKRDSTGHGNME